jgi:hypothetical protein
MPWPLEGWGGASPIRFTSASYRPIAARLRSSSSTLGILLTSASATLLTCGLPGCAGAAG